MHMHVTLFFVFHTCFSFSAALPQPQPPIEPGTLHYGVEWIAPKYPFQYSTITSKQVPIRRGDSRQIDKLVQDAPLIQEAVDKCSKGDCKYHGEGRHGTAWLVTLLDNRQHVLKVMFGRNTRNGFTDQEGGYRDHRDTTPFTIEKDLFARIVYLTNRAAQLEAFAILKDKPNDITAFYILMPYLGLTFRQAFNAKRDKFTKETPDGSEIFAWSVQGQAIQTEYGKSYGVRHSDAALTNFVFAENPWDVRLVDWSDGSDIRFPSQVCVSQYSQIAKLVVEVKDTKRGYYNDDTNNDHKKNRQEMVDFVKQLRASEAEQTPLPLGFK